MRKTARKMTRRRGAWSETFSGVKFWPADPLPEEVRIEDIAHALSRQCRFAGHVREFYSVAQHSVLVADNVPPADKLAGLLHDAAEAYVVDIQSPVKWTLREFADRDDAVNYYDWLEARVFETIARRFGISNILPKSVKEADLRALFTERRDLRGPAVDLWEGEGTPPFPDPIVALAPDAARALFLERFHLYTAAGCPT